MKILQNNRNYCGMLVLGLSLLILSGLSLETVYAATYTQAVTFAADNQSMWGPGSALTIEYGGFGGPQWNEGVSLGGIATDPIFGTRWGMEVWARTHGRIGLEWGIELDSGSVDAYYPVQVELDIPDDAKPGDVVTVSSRYSVNSSAFFETNFPDFYAYAELVAEVYASIGAEACVGGCIGGSWTFNESASQELLAFNRNHDGQLRLLGNRVAGFDFGREFPIAGGYGDITVWQPDINTRSGAPSGDTLSASGTDRLLQAEFDIDRILTSVVGFPSLEGELFGFLDYNLLDIGVGPGFSLEQSFFFDPNLTINLDLGGGETVRFLAGQSATFVMPDHDLTITPTFSLPNTFRNDTDLGIGIGGSLDILEASWNIFGFTGSLGPLYSGSFYTPLTDVSLFDRSFQLAFNDVTTSAFTINAIQTVVPDPDPTPTPVPPVPEPTTLVLLGVGLLGLVGLRRRGKN